MSSSTAVQEMFLATQQGVEGWQRQGLRPYGPLSMDPAAQVLNYGQSIFEGMKVCQLSCHVCLACCARLTSLFGIANNRAKHSKASLCDRLQAQRTERGRIVLFRPKDNAARMRDGAARMSMAAPPEDLFLDAVTSTVAANAHMVPPVGKGSLYLRPLLLGTGSIVGLGPAPSYTFTCFGTAVGSYFVVRFGLARQLLHTSMAACRHCILQCLRTTYMRRVTSLRVSSSH
jgi:branched-chain amino acid aminotransferase